MTHTDADDGPTTDRRRTDGGESGQRSRYESSLSAEAREYLWWIALGGLVLVIMVAGANFYGAAGAAIDVWISERYQPLIRAAFNLAVVLVAGGGIAWLVRLHGE